MQKIETYYIMRNTDIFPFPIPVMVIVSMVYVYGVCSVCVCECAHVYMCCNFKLWSM